MTKLFVGSLPFTTSEEELHSMFTAFGRVASAKLINDRETGRSRGFGFVEMPNDDQAQAAIAALNGTAVDGRNVVVNESRPKPEGSGGGGGFKKRSFGGGGGGGYRGNRGGGDYNRDSFNNGDF